jgi:tetratricopeptide (TPR) repeat protein
VQYLAIVWLYNCRRVNSNADLNGFMRYLFRRGMVLLYLGLITAYGAIGLVGPLVSNGTISNFFYGVLFTSTILHYYYDGFIWKVREPVNQASLGLTQSTAAFSRWTAIGNRVHSLKWGAAIVVLGLVFATDFLNPPLSTSRKEELGRTYTQTLVSRPSLPEKDEEVSWLYTRFKAAQDIAAAVPDDRQAQMQAAVMLANFGQNEEAVQRLEKLLQQHPDQRDAHIALGDIHYYRGNLDQASVQYQSALSQARTGQERSTMNLRLGEIDLHQQDFAAAKAKFQAALRDDPRLAASVEALEKGSPASRGPRSP